MKVREPRTTSMCVCVCVCGRVHRGVWSLLPWLPTDVSVSDSDEEVRGLGRQALALLATAIRNTPGVSQEIRM